MNARRLVALAVSGIALIAARPAAAHVTANPSEATKGGFAKISFRVPNERDDASTVQVEVQLPADHPIENVSLRPVPGWVGTVSGGTITWSGGPINPGEFQEFDVSLGPLPDDTDELVFNALQTYSDGEVVRWIEPTPESGEEPEHPAPVVHLVEGDGGHSHGGTDDGDDDETTATTVATGDGEDEPADDAGDDEASGGITAQEIASVQDDADGAQSAANIGIAIGAAALAIAVIGLALGRRRSQSQGQS